MADELEGIPTPGEVLLGKYRVERVLGAGGMGAVVAATHLSLGQRVAIKFLLVEAAKVPSSVERFHREAQAAAAIKSEHVARVSDIGTLEDGSPYMVMEHLDGQDLSDALRDHGPLDPAAAVRYLLEAGEAIAEAHAAGIVHRDLKPANLFLARRPDGSSHVKVLDFGISKIQSPAAGDLTRTSAMMGSPLYMAPEQMVSAKTADHRADIWALGTILFEMLTGVSAFDGETLPEICSRILTCPHRDVRTLAPNMPPELVAAIARCLQKEPAARFQSVAELAGAVAPVGGPAALLSADTIRRVLGAASPPAAARTALSHPTAMGAAPTAYSTGPEATPWSAGSLGASTAEPVAAPLPGAAAKRPPLALAAAALVCLIGGAVAVTLLLSRRDTGSGTAIATSSASATQVDAEPPAEAPLPSSSAPAEPAAATATAATASATASTTASSTPPLRPSPRGKAPPSTTPPVIKPPRGRQDDLFNRRD